METKEKAQGAPYFKRCLSEEFAKRCSRNPRYSLRAFARALELDPAALSRMISGKLLPSARMADVLLSRLSLSPLQRTEFLESLAETHRERHVERLSPVFKKQRQGNILRVSELNLELFRVISDWYHYAILELSQVESYRSDSKWVASQLGISPAEAKLAMDRLVELGLLEVKNGKKTKSKMQITTADKHVSTPALRKRQQQILEKAIISLEEDSIDLRNHSAMTMAIDPSRIPEAKRMIERFQNELCEYLEGGKSTQVYELSTVLFPLQKTCSKARSQS